MNSLSRYNVLNQMITELAVLRRTSRARRTAYLTLALAILGDEPSDLLSPTTFHAEPAALAQAVAAA
jgi:hypothetical protein